MVKRELQNDSQAADHATMIDENLDRERNGSDRHVDPETVRWIFNHVVTWHAELRSDKFFATAQSFVMVKWSSNANQTRSPKERKFAIEAVFHTTWDELR